jgi:peptidoglycan/xylan/chitin deacetylase (PgdA/CDA1 family)
MEVKGLVLRSTSPQVCLTFDACGGPYGSKVDSDLLTLLTTQRIPATLFLNQRWIEANRATFDEIASRPDLFDIGNHGTRHMPLSVTGKSAYNEPGTKDVAEVYDEVAGNHTYLTGLLGRPPRFFRTGTAHYDEVAIEIVRAMGEIPIGFDINGDAGTTYTAALVAQETGKAKPGSIVIAHLNQPARQTYEGMAVVLPRLRDKGVRFARLSDVTIA